MKRRRADILIIGGGPSGIAALAAASAATDGAALLTLLDDNPRLGGQIWRAELGKTTTVDAANLIRAFDRSSVEIFNNAQVFAAMPGNILAAETPEGRVEFEYEKLIIATGARERFLPFPGWTLPNVFGVGGLQSLVKGGMDVKKKRIVVAGTGALLLAVAEYLRSKGATVVAIAEQAAAARINKFAIELRREPAKLIQAAILRAKLIGIPYLTDSWVTTAFGDNYVESVELCRKGKTWSVECDLVACGFHLVPNVELASLIGCRIENGRVTVDAFQRTSCENVYCAGEPTGIAGLDASLVEGKIAGFAAGGDLANARALLSERDRSRKFGQLLDRTFEVREELRHLVTETTIVCRCEDVEFGRLREFQNWRTAKLQTRCGMGPCQGRVCGAAAEFLFGWEADSVRPPIFPVKMENL